MYISGGIIASFLVISLFGMYNSYWVYIIPWLPMIAMYPFAQKFFTQGTMVGSVKI